MGRPNTRSKKIIKQPVRYGKLLVSSRVAKITAAVAVLAVVTIGILSLSPATTSPAAAKLPPDEARIATDDTLLKQYIEAYGAEKTIAYMKTLPVDCHQRVHKVGRFNYELRGNAAFKVLDSECMSGYTHGVTEAFFHKNGTENLSKSLELICDGKLTGFYAHQCYHGVGHGLMAFSDYDLPAALKDCDKLPQIATSKESCYSGAFMENVVGAISVEKAKSQPDSDFHTSSWLNDDPLFPCNSIAVNERYKNACYTFQTSRMVQVVGFDFAKVTAACLKAEAQYQYTCFSSMGRDVSSSNRNDYAAIEIACHHTNDANLNLSCINGASQDKFWHESQQDDALGMCKAMQRPEAKENCYRTLSDRGREIITTREGSKQFCAKYEAEYAGLCIEKI